MRYITTNNPVADAAAHVAESLKQHLSRGERVLWLLSGGSGIAVGVAASQQLGDTSLANLHVTMTDERYGPVGHPDENWQQLLSAGFAVPGAKLYRPLKGADRATTTTAFDGWLKTQFAQADYRIAIFGLGSDGHTAGIKPDTSAVSASGYATSFDGEDFERITITFQAINRLDEAVIQASGTDKAPIIYRLRHDRPSLSDTPASILHKVPLSTLYTNNKEEN